MGNINVDLSGKSAIVTGASTGIGFTIAQRLSEAGARITGIARTEDRLQKSLDQLDGPALAVPGDVQEKETAERAVERTMDEFESVDILVNNAGVNRDNLILRMKEEEWDQVMDVNLGGTFHFSKRVAKRMMRQKEGRIINMSSVVGLRGNAGQSNYVASKAGIIGFTKSLARELGSRNITVNAIAPGYIETSMTDELPENQRDEILENIPLDRLGNPSDVADAVLFLASDGASYMTGQTIVVDGGMYT